MSDNESPLPDLRYVRELAKVFRTYGLDEMEIETGEQRILLRRGDGGAPPTMVTTQVAAPAAALGAPAPAAAPEPPAEEGDFITSPFVGTYYIAPNPEADPFVKVGDSIAAGQTVCIVEAMKLFNEIESDFACVIEELLVNNGEGVEFGAKLFKVRRL
jgi:acetyl-CoA carboxylase biotin carboxyl carrier protein